MTKSTVTRRAVIGTGVALAAFTPATANAAQTPSTVSPAMYAAIEGHREVKELADRGYDQLCLNEASDTPPTVNQRDEINQLVATSRKLYVELVSMVPAYPGDNSARAEYMLEAFEEDALQDDEVVLFLTSLVACPA